jgi:hypothetical protein
MLVCEGVGFFEGIARKMLARRGVDDEVPALRADRGVYLFDGH